MSSVLGRVTGAEPGSEIGGGERAEIIVELVVMGVFEHGPGVVFVVDGKAIEIFLPFSLKHSITALELGRDEFIEKWNSLPSSSDVEGEDDVDDYEGAGNDQPARMARGKSGNAVQLVVPDGDVMAAVARHLKALTSLDPLEFDVGPNAIAACGVFETFTASIGFLVPIIFVPSEMSLTCEMRAPDPLLVFVLCEKMRALFLL